MDRVLYTVVLIVVYVAVALLWANPAQADTVLYQPGCGGDYECGSYEGGSWKLSDGGFVLTGSPIPQTARLQSVIFMKGAVVGEETTGNLYLKVFSGNTGGQGTFVGVSNNTVDAAGLAKGDLETWTFSNLALNRDLSYSYVADVSNDNSNPSAVFAIQLSLKTNPLTTGGPIRGDGLVDWEWDPCVSVSIASVPEPSPIVLLSMGLLGLLAYLSRAETFMRAIRVVIVLVLLAGPADAANYYVATNGSNSNSGTLAQPYLTIQKAADAAQTGDNVYVLGGTYRETVTVHQSGTALAPITFQPYRGANVTITGLDSANSGWSNAGGSIYSRSVSSGVSQVFVDGQLMLGARWPNAVYNNPLRSVGSTISSVTLRTPPTYSVMGDTALAGTGSWIGAKMSILAGDGICAFGTTVTDQSGTQCNFTWSYPRSSGYDARAGNSYYLYGSLNALDAVKEWYYDSSTAKLYLNGPGGTNPSNQNIEVRSRQYGFDLGVQSNINIKGFQLQAASIKIEGNSNTVDNCQILYPRAVEDPTGSIFTVHGGGVEISGQYNTVRNSEIGYSFGDGVTLLGSHNTVTNNVIHDVNWLGSDCAAVTSYSSGGNQTITNNTMYNAGRCLIANEGDIPNMQIENNDLSRFGMLTNDLGAIYTSKGINDGTVIAYNRVHNDTGPVANTHTGIYLDNHTSGVTVHNNLVYNTNNGVTVNKNSVVDNGQPNNASVYNNTLWNVTTVMSSWGPDGFALTNVKTYNNLSNNDGWVGTDVQNNLAQTADPFVDSDAGNYTLVSGTIPIGYGMTDSSHPTDPYTGSAPDAGAFELGIAPWTDGANWKTWLRNNQAAAPLTNALYVTSSNDRTINGSLIAGNSGGIETRAFVKFDLLGIANVPIAKAVLRIYENAVPDSASGDISLYRIISDWTDANVVYGQSVDATALSGFYDPANLDLYTDIDVTSIVRDWLNGTTTNYGFSLRGTEGVAGTAKYFEGLYGTTMPQLVITHAVPEPDLLGLMASGVLASVGFLAFLRRRSLFQIVATLWQNSGKGVVVTRPLRQSTDYAVSPVLCFVLAISVCCVTAIGAETQPLKGLLYNDDADHFFCFTPPIPAGKAGEVIDRYVDVMADAGVTVYLCGTNYRRTNYRSRVWDSYWDGYDPTGPDDQPFLAALGKGAAGYRKHIDNMLAVHQQGIDYPARVVRRCRHNGMSPWITLRMNDCHYSDVPAHPFHGRFWRENPQWYRKNCTGYFSTCLDYANREVRDYYRALVVETLDRYDIDGLELDFMREPYLFSVGKEAEGAAILTRWMRDIRKLVEDAAAKRGHPICLGVRVPSRPEVASALGLDAIAWTKEKLIDLLVVTPRWATVEFDMPIQKWRKMLGTSKVTLAGGLEVLYRPSPGTSAAYCSPEMATGAAVLVLSGGADVVYLFNYFQEAQPGWSLPDYQTTLRAMCSLNSLLKQPRRVGITYRDITAPGEQYQAPLPATGDPVVFPIKLGPIPESGWSCDLLIEFAPSQGGSVHVPAVFFDGKSCEVHNDETTQEGLRLISWRVPPTTSAGNDTHEVKVISKGLNNITIQRVEVSVREPRIEGNKAP